MFGVGVPELLIIALVLLVPAAVVLVLLVVVRSTQQPVAVRREWRWVQLTRVVGVVVGVWLAVLVWQRGSYGTGPMLAPAAFGLCVVLAAAIGETVVRPRRAGGVRSASLTPRRVRDYLAPRLSAAVGLVVLLAVVVLTLTTLTASRDDYTGGMRALSCSTATSGSSHTPYAGSYYSLPLAAVLVAVLLVAALATRQVVRRPRGMAGDDVGDDALRRRSLDVIVCAVGIAVSAPYVGISLTTMSALRSLGTAQPSCAAGWMAPVGTVIGLTTLLAFAIGAVCLVRLLTGAPSVVRQREVVAG